MKNASRRQGRNCNPCRAKNDVQWPVCTIMATYTPNSTQQGPSWGADSSSASQERHRIVHNPKFHTAFTTAPQLSLSWARSVHPNPPPSYFWKLNCNIVFHSAPKSSNRSFSLQFPHQNPVYTSPGLYAYNMPRPYYYSSSRFYHSNHIWRGCSS